MIAEAQPADMRFGHDLEAYLIELGHAGISISIADRVAVKALAAELLGRDAVKTLEDFKPYIQAVLARTPEHARLFAVEKPSTPETTPAVPEEAVSEDPQREVERRVETAGRSTRSVWRWLAVLVVILSVASFGWAFRAEIIDWLRFEKEPSASSTPRPAQAAARPLPPTASTAEKKVLTGPAETLARVLDASRSFQGAPTLAELARELKSDEPAKHEPASLARALHELTGAPIGRPLDLLGLSAGGAKAWGERLARAIDRIERPEAVRPPNAYSLAGEGLDERVTAIRSLLSSSEDLATPEGRAAALARLQEKTERARTIGDARLRAILAPDTLRPKDKAQWSRQLAPLIPNWVQPVIAMTPLVIGAFWLLARFLSERAYLRRRRPRRPPNRTEFVAEALSNAVVWTPTDQRVAQTLMFRDERETDRLDVHRTIRASLAKGGRLIELQNERLRPVPEYLVLIEEDRSGDHTAQRLRDLLTPFRQNAHLHFDVYTYQETPSVLRTEDGAASILLEAVRAKHPDHRLIILGTGHGFVAFPDGAPLSFLETIRAWDRRVLLTPQPLSEWGRREFMIADALDAPVGRATRNGFRTVGDLLGLAGPPPEPRPDPTGDGRLTELPESIRLDPNRLLYDDPPVDIEVDDLLRDLSSFLDRDGFRWLSALAVFPVIQWDMTLYLGLRMPTERDLLLRRVDPLTAKDQKLLVSAADFREHCFRDDALGDRRLSALSRLPWLRNGFMPEWLREALIERLSKVDRGEIYRAIDQALESSETTDAVSGEVDRLIRLRIGRDASRGRAQDFEPREDELLLDFLARGDRGDYPLPVGFQDRFRRQSDRFLATGRNQRLAALAVLTAMAAWLASPVGGNPTVTGAWWPLTLVGLGAIVALLLERWLDRAGSEPEGARPTRLFSFWSRRGSDGRSYQRAEQETQTPTYPPLSRFRDRLRDGSHGPEMVVIPAGEFLMGSAEGEGYDSERPQHSVVIPEAFAVGRYPVTFAEWDAALAAGAIEYSPEDEGWGRGRRPVINVSWEDAQQYISWLNSQTPDAPYRLLSEAEWEYCCRAGSTTQYSWGDDVRRIGDFAWYSENSNDRTHPVGEKSPNAFGLHDMHGNVWEWCADEYHENYNGAPTDGSSRQGEGMARVLRGGSWIQLLRRSSAQRAVSGDRPDGRDDYLRLPCCEDVTC